MSSDSASARTKCDGETPAGGDRIQNIITQLQQLEEIRQQLENEPLAPPGAWIHEYNVRKFYPSSKTTHTYTYAKWQANEPIFLRNPKKYGHKSKSKFTKHQHIGRVWSSTNLGIEPEVLEAYEQLENRKKLDAIDAAISQLETTLATVMPLVVKK